MKKKSKIFLILIFFLFFFLSLPGCKDETDRPNPFGKEINQKAKRIYKNQKGCWEAEFDYGIVMIYIPSGEFTMGSNDGSDEEKPEHKVYLDGYWIGKYEVTFEQYDKYCEETGKKKPKDEGWGRGKRPVINVSWKDATAYCEWLSQKICLKFRLPAEAQWERAARGTDRRHYPWGNEFDKNKCNSWESGLEITRPVGKYPEGVSPYGCFDMAGNVWEWCSDWYKDNYYKDSPSRNPEGPADGFERVLRGGSCCSEALCWARINIDPGSHCYACGFRLSGSLR